MKRLFCVLVVSCAACTGGAGGGSGLTPSSTAAGFSGAGPWPAGNVQYASADGIAETPVIGFSTDESQNLWVATHAALYLRRPGDARFRRYAAPDGLHLQGNPVAYCDDWAPDHACPIYGAASAGGITEITGGGPNEVFVGYEGVTDGSGDYTDPNRHSGALDRVRVGSDGKLSVTRLQMVSGASVEFWHNRTVERLLYDHFLHPHELYVGTNHGVDRMLPDLYREPKKGEWFNDVNKEWMGDHLHPQVCYHHACQGETDLRLGDWRGLALASNGDLWVAGRWTAGAIVWTRAPADWFSRPGAQTFSIAFGDPYPQQGANPGFVNEPVFRPPQEGDPVALSAVTVARDGRVWFASGATYTQDPSYGVAVWDGHVFKTYDPQRDLGMGEGVVRDLVALPDGRIALASSLSGVTLYDPATGKSTQLRGSTWLPSDRVLRLELDRMVEPAALHVSTMSGAASLRQLP